MDAGKRVHFDEIRNAVAIATDVDTSDVAKAERQTILDSIVFVGAP